MESHSTTRFAEHAERERERARYMQVFIMLIHLQEDQNIGRDKREKKKKSNPLSALWNELMSCGFQEVWVGSLLGVVDHS